MIDQGSVDVLDMIRYLVGMRSAIDKYLVHPCVCKKFERILNERSVCQRKKALQSASAPKSCVIDLPDISIPDFMVSKLF